VAIGWVWGSVVWRQKYHCDSDMSHGGAAGWDSQLLLDISFIVVKALPTIILAVFGVQYTTLYKALSYGGTVNRSVTRGYRQMELLWDGY
jgi:hypothetical protein